MKTFLNPIFLGAALLISVSSVDAATLLAIDFGIGATQADFTSWNPAPTDGGGIRSTTFTTSVGTISATLAGGVTAADLTTSNSNYSTNTRDRAPNPPANGAFTATALFSDRVVATGVTGGTTDANSGLLLRLGGFAANTTYTIQLWGYEANNTGTAKFVNFYNLNSGSDVLLGGYTTTAGQTPTTNNDFSITTTITTDSSGNLLLKSRSNYDGVGIFSGLRISDIPEPSSAALLVLGAVACGGRRRRA